MDSLGLHTDNHTANLLQAAYPHPLDKATLQHTKEQLEQADSLDQELDQQDQPTPSKPKSLEKK